MQNNTISYSCEIKKSQYYFVSFILFISTFLVTRHINFNYLGYLLVPWVLFVMFFLLRLKFVFFYGSSIFVYAIFAFFIGLFLNEDILSSVRFFVILIATVFAFCVRSVRVNSNIILLPIFFQSAIVFLISIYFSFIQDENFAKGVRDIVLSNLWGDIYSHDGLYYRVQLIGNALVPFLFFVALWSPSSRSRYVFLVASFLGVLAAGNMTYVMGVFLALFLRYRGFFLNKKGALSFIFVIFVLFLFSFDIYDSWMKKFDGADSSMGIRFDQVDTYLSAIAQDPYILLVGAGLGSAFPDGQQRDYSNFNYIELQTLFVFYKIGIVGFFIYFFSICILLYLRLSVEGRLIFFLYIFSSITNPYIFDINQIIVSIILVQLFPVKSNLLK